MEKYVEECAEKNEEMICKEAFTRFSLDAIATSAFGIDLNTFEEPESTFRKQIKELQHTPDSQSGSPWEMFKVLLTLFIPITKSFVPVEQFPSKSIVFIQNALIKTVEMRKS